MGRIGQGWGKLGLAAPLDIGHDGTAVDQVPLAPGERDVAAAGGLGSLSHLVLDEIYSVDTRGVVPRCKKSFGSAVKLWGKHPTANFSTYAKLALVTAAMRTSDAAERTACARAATAIGDGGLEEALAGFKKGRDAAWARFGPTFSRVRTRRELVALAAEVEAQSRV